MFPKIPDKCFALSGTTDGNIAARFRDDNHPVIPGLSRDLFEKAVISKQLMLDVS